MPLAYGTLFTERKQHKKQSNDQWRLLKKWQKNKCDNKINQVFFIFNTRYISVNRKDFRASTLVGPTRDNLVLEYLSVQHLDKLLYNYFRYRGLLYLHNKSTFIMSIWIFPLFLEKKLFRQSGNMFLSSAYKIKTNLVKMKICFFLFSFYW